MGKWEEKLTHAAHIKRHTKGTSNELSFSVLDAAKNALDGEQDDTPSGRPFGRISLFTLPGKRKKPSGTPTKEKGLPLSTGDFVSVEGSDASTTRLPLPKSSGKAPARLGLPSSPIRGALPAPVPAKPSRSPEEEIARRKARRRVSKLLAVAVIIVITGALLAAGGSYLYHEYQVQQSNISVLDESLLLIGQTDETINALDKAVSDPFAQGAAETRAQVRAGANDALSHLASADEKARQASADLRESKEKEVANQTVATILARQTILDKGMQLMDAADAAQQAANQVDAAWEGILQADALARDAAQLVTDTTQDNVKASKDKTNEAIAAFEKTLGTLTTAQNDYPEATLDILVDYVEKRLEALGYALASDDALLAKDKDEAARQNEAYNKADGEAATLAEDIPKDPSSLVFTAYEQSVADTMKAYSTARLQAEAADAFIHDYLGTESK